MTSKIIFLTVGDKPCNLVSSLVAFPTGTFTFNKSIVSLFNGSSLPPCCSKEVWSTSLHVQYSYYSRNFVDTTLFFIVPNYGNRFWKVLASLKSCKNSPFFHFFNLCFSVITWSLLFEDFDGFCSSNVSITCKANIAHSMIGLSINHSLMDPYNFFNVIFATWSFW